MAELLYKSSVDPISTDRRDINSAVGELVGEGAQQAIVPDEIHQQALSTNGESLPVSRADDPTYYGRPILKEPVWKWIIPLYYFVGGAAGASLVMGAAAQLDRSGKLDNMARRCHRVGIIGSALSGAILILDLGKPSRFHHMLRVFRPTSPMNMGVWIISAVAPSAVVAGLCGNRPGFLGAIGNLSGVAAGLAGLSLATYTGVLISNTAVPVWQESRCVLPLLFGASAMASAGSIFDLAFEDQRARRVTYTFGTIGRVAELATSIALERQAALKDPLIARPLNTGVSGILWKAAGLMTLASLIVSALPGKSRKKRVAAGILGALGSLTMRYGIHYAGVASARDPKATFRQQRD